MKKYFFYIIALLSVSCETTFFSKKDSFLTRFEQSNGTESADYQEVIDFYRNLSNEYGTIHLKTMGQTDSGFPLHIVTYSTDAEFNFSKLQKEKVIVLISNAIHAGEPDGVDATMLLFRNLAQQQIKTPKNVVIVAIPIYNIGGALNRNSVTRVNQNGPTEYGFRANTLNYDLNRDFIKADSEDARSFTKIFQLVNPDIFIDNHTTNGADYQHIITYSTSQFQKSGKFIGNYTRDKLLPQLSDTLVKRQNEFKSDSLPKPLWKPIPYVNVWNQPPDYQGYSAFMDTPRYSTGYANLFNSIGILIETHMLKPYKERVEANYEMMKGLIEILNTDNQKVKDLRKKQFEEDLAQNDFPLEWELDSANVSKITFHGYKADTLISEVTGLKRIKYDREAPFVKEIPFFEHYKVKKMAKVPSFYIVPKQWKSVIERLKINKIEMTEIQQDTLMPLHCYRIEDFKTTAQAFEGHYLHFDTKVSKKEEKIQIRKGDFLISVNQTGKRYILATLEPESPDSFFNWNFFDTILQQKEHFSPYLFEEIASEYLKNNPSVLDSLEKMRKNDKNFANNAFLQLDWIYKQTPHYEKEHLRYPIYFSY